MKVDKNIVVAGVLGFLLLPGVAQGSRAELEGRGLPHLLSLDPSVVRFFPGSAGRFQPGLLLDYSRNTYSRSILGGFSLNESDRFAMILLGNSTHYGYILDGKTHTVIVASPSGWGLNLGFSDDYSKSDTFDQLDGFGSNPDRLRISVEEVSRRTLRLGLGFQSITASERVFEIGIGGSYLDVDITDFWRETVDTVVTEFATEINSDPGFRLDVFVRSVSLNSGLQIAGSFSYEDLNPKTAVPFGLSPIIRSGSFHLGWRLETPHLDDLTIGWTSEWKNGISARSLFLSGARVAGTKETELRGGLFMSGEREVLENLVARGGIQGLGSFVESTFQSFERAPFAFQRVVKRTNSRGQVEVPEIFLGGTWKWKQLVVDVQLNETINLDAPFVRWAATVEF